MIFYLQIIKILFLRCFVSDDITASSSKKMPDVHFFYPLLAKSTAIHTHSVMHSFLCTLKYIWPLSLSSQNIQRERDERMRRSARGGFGLGVCVTNSGSETKPPCLCPKR